MLRTGFEEDKNFHVVLNSVIAGRYHVTEYLGSAAFSKAIQAHDLHTGMDVCVKIIKNNKDFFDQSLDEIKLLKYVNKHDPADKYHILRLYDYFYYRVSGLPLILLILLYKLLSKQSIFILGTYTFFLYLILFIFLLFFIISTSSIIWTFYLYCCDLVYLGDDEYCYYLLLFFHISLFLSFLFSFLSDDT